MSEQPQLDIQKITDLARASVGKIPVGNVDAILVPSGYTLQSLAQFQFNEFQPAPHRIVAHPVFADVESFCAYVTAFNSNGKIFADEGTRKILAVLDYSVDASTPRWGSHRATLALKHSEEWNMWFGQNDKSFTQAAFAEFLEQNGIDITDPTPAAMMEIARDLQGTTEVSFGAGVRLANGSVRFRYTEETKGTVGGESVEVPESFLLSIPLFVGGESVNIRALLRYRVKEGKLVIWYSLVRPEATVRTAFDLARNSAAAKLGVTILNGSDK